MEFAKMENNKGIMLVMLLLWFDCSESQNTFFDVVRDVYMHFVMPTSQVSGNLQLAEEQHKLQPRISDEVRFPCNLNGSRSEKRPTNVHTLRPGDIDVVGAIGDSIFSGNGLVATNVLQIGVENRGMSFAMVRFPCNLNGPRSEKRPTNVHTLRPGDIDVVGAIGDSIFSGNGLVATNILQIGVENQGMSFALGGQATWRQFLTVPNILKEFNHNLTGYSLEDSYIHHTASQFNVAVPAVISADIPSLARMLIKRIESSPIVNIKEDWKMIFILIGANDFCSRMCYYRNPEIIFDNHRKHLLEVLRILRDNLPRTMVILILTPNYRTFANTTRSNMPSECYFTHSVFCSCLFGSQFEQLQGLFDQIMKKWQEVQLEVVNSQEFDRDDFTVVAQPFTINYTLHKTAAGLTDYSDLSADCFHMSQKEAARAALSLWNNLLEPVGSKTTTLSELFNIKCPNNQHRYIFTRRNSLSVKNK